VLFYDVFAVLNNLNAGVNGMAGSRLKHILALAGHSTGLLTVLKQVRLRGGAVIFMYHRVLLPEAAACHTVQPGMYVSLQNFKRQMGWIQAYFSILPLQELVLRLQTNKDISGCCALTFDDGWVDNYHNVYPIIKQYEIPITVFLATGFIGTGKWFWPEKVADFLFLVASGKTDTGLVSKNLKESLLKNRLFNKKELKTVIQGYIENLKHYPSNLRQKLLEEMNSACQNDKTLSLRYLMNWNEIREMSSSGLVDFGSHTVNHRLLDQISPDQAVYEVLNSKDQIELETGQRCLLFAYPNGNYTGELIHILKETGMSAAVTTQRGYVTHRRSLSLLELPRISIHEDVSNSLALFLWRILVQ